MGFTSSCENRFGFHWCQLLPQPLKIETKVRTCLSFDLVPIERKVRAYNPSISYCFPFIIVIFDFMKLIYKNFIISGGKLSIPSSSVIEFFKITRSLIRMRFQFNTFWKELFFEKHNIIKVVYYVQEVIVYY